MLDGLDHDDGVVDHDADRQHQRQKGHGIGGKAQRQHDREGANQGDGTAMMGIRVARRLPRKMKTTMPTSTKASTSVWMTLSMVASTNTVVSYMTS